MVVDIRAWWGGLIDPFQLWISVYVILFLQLCDPIWPVNLEVPSQPQPRLGGLQIWQVHLSAFSLPFQFGSGDVELKIEITEHSILKCLGYMFAMWKKKQICFVGPLLIFFPWVLDTLPLWTYWKWWCLYSFKRSPSKTPPVLLGRTFDGSSSKTLKGPPLKGNLSFNIHKIEAIE